MTTEMTRGYRAHTNIALIKYWGKRNQSLFLPLTSSLSMTLNAFYTDTRAYFIENATSDIFYLDGQLQSEKETAKVSKFIDLFRSQASSSQRVCVESYNHVPTAAGLASSASAYAALACALNALFELNLSAQALSVFARQGSGSASRSLFGGFVEWHKGEEDDSASSFAEPFDKGDWDIAMLAVIVNSQKKKMSSREGMQLTVETSPFYTLWPQEVAQDLIAIKHAIKERNFNAVGRIAEHNAMKMHATMIAANPSFTYWEADSLCAMNCVRMLRENGVDCYFTMDAGPNVKVLCRQSELNKVHDYFSQFFDASRLVSTNIGPAPYVIPWEYSLNTDMTKEAIV